MAKGTIDVKNERCKGCAFCVEFCPPHVLALSATYNARGYHPPELIDPERCTGCDLCGLYCPDFAIHGFPLPKSSAVAKSSQSEQSGADATATSDGIIAA